jgi:hypothetical protein
MGRALLTAGLLFCLVVPAGSAAAGKKKEEPYALLFGMVFTEKGFALPGIAVSVKGKDDTKPRWHEVSDRRGEFAVRLPAGPGTYEVSTHSEEYENQSKTVEVRGTERVEVLFRLATKKEEKKQ